MQDGQEVVASLRESGLSTRAIAAATGISRETVRQELSSGDKKLPPAQVGQIDPPAAPTSEQVLESPTPANDDPIAAATGDSTDTVRRALSGVWNPDT